MENFWQQFINDEATSLLSGYLIVGIKILLSFAEGTILGIERRMRQQAIGMRTLILISVASTLIMIVSIHLGKAYNADASRVAAQVVSGIGFLGGGAILRQGLNIRGLTSAATIWCAASLGLAVGAGLYVPSLLALLVFMIALVLLEKIKLRYFPAERTKILTLIFNEENFDYKKLRAIIQKHGLIIINSDIDKKINEKKLEIKFSVRSPEETDVIALSNDINSLGNLDEIKLSMNDAN